MRTIFSAVWLCIVGLLLWIMLLFGIDQHMQMEAARAEMRWQQRFDVEGVR